MGKNKTLIVTPLPEPTLDQRNEWAHADSASAVSAFTSAAAELEVAADDLDAVAAEARAIADRHVQLALAATTQAELNRTRAVKIRNLLG